MAGLSREVVKWIQSLDLTWQMKTPKWDLTNGYLIGEIFSWYYPQDIQMHNFNNGTSLDSKQRNWYILNTFIKRHNLDIPQELIEGTIHCKEGAAALLTEHIYELLTNRKIRKISPDYDVDLTDRGYQVKLPLHARSTAAKSIKNNLKATEIKADPSLVLSQQRAQEIINSHIEHRCIERSSNPEYFNRQPTLGELALRRPPKNTGKPNQQEIIEEGEQTKDRTSMEDKKSENANYREVVVKQLGSAGQARSTQGLQ